MHKNMQNNSFSAEQLPPYSVRISKRAKRITLRIAPHKGLEIVLPQGVALSCIPEILTAKKRWILEKWPQIMRPNGNESKEHPLPLIPFSLYLLGGTEKIIFAQTQEQAEQEASHNILLPIESKITPPKVRTVLIPKEGATKDNVLSIVGKNWIMRWLKSYAESYFMGKLQEIAIQNTFSFSGLHVGFPRSRWGCCTAKKRLSLSGYLLFLPEPQIRYVLIHELCHTQHLNHSPAFWKKVFLIEPQAMQLDKLLRYGRKYIPQWLYR